MKRLIAILLVLTALTLCACEKTEVEEEVTLNRYSLEFLDIPDSSRGKFIGGGNGMSITEEKIIINSNKVIEDPRKGLTVGEHEIHIYDLITNEYTFIEPKLEECDAVMSLQCIDDELIICGRTLTEPPKFYFYRRSIEDGELTLSGGKEFFGFSADSIYHDGQIYSVGTNNRRYTLDGVCTGYVHSDLRVEKLDVIDGIMRAQFEDGTYKTLVFSDEVTDPNDVTDENGEFLPYDGIYNKTPEGYTEHIGLDGRVYLSNTDGLYAYDGTSMTEMFNWYDANLDSPDVTKVFSEDKILLNIYDPLYNETRTAILRRLPEEEAKPIKLIKAALMTKKTEYVIPQFLAFNLHNDEYRIVYTEFGGYENPSFELSKALNNGEKFDLLVSAKDDLMSTMINKGYLYDLSDKIEDVLLDSVAASYPDGKIYSIFSHMYINTLLATGDYDIADMTKYDGEAQLLSCESREMLKPAALVGQFVDGTTCNFYSDEFIDLLEFAKYYEPEKDIEYGAGIYSHFTGEYAEAIQNGDLLTRTTTLGSIEDFIAAELEFGGDYKAIGFTNGGYSQMWSYTNYSAFSVGNCPDGAIAYIDFCLSDEFQTRLSTTTGGGRAYTLPVTKSGLKALIEKYSDYDYVLVSVQQVSQVYMGAHVSLYPSTAEFVGNIKYPRYPIKQETLDRAYEILNDEIRLAPRNSDIEEIITEELEAFFGGATTAAHCAELIQNRVSTLLAERS